MCFGLGGWLGGSLGACWCYSCGNGCCDCFLLPFGHHIFSEMFNRSRQFIFHNFLLAVSPHIMRRDSQQKVVKGQNVVSYVCFLADSLTS